MKPWPLMLLAVTVSAANGPAETPATTATPAFYCKNGTCYISEADADKIAKLIKDNAEAVNTMADELKKTRKVCTET